jgi:energy-coupling factor transporter ATP-binding protein EcfA2
VIDFDHVTVTYADAPGPVLVDVKPSRPRRRAGPGGRPTGVGKSTLFGAVNGLVPHFTGGTLAGRVTVDGRDTRTHPPRELADVVGVVGQDPLSGFVTDTVEEELAYSMEQLAVPPDVMRKRVEETLDLLGIAELRDRPLHQLSGGQQQRVAIGSVLTAHPRILVLDEPTSALDPTAAEEVLAAITRLVHDLGVTVLLAEHRLERVVQYADRIVEVRADGTVSDGPPASMLATTTVAPPVIELGRLAGWDPLPLSVRDARRHAGALRARLSAGLHPSPPRSAAPARAEAIPGVVSPQRGRPLRPGRSRPGSRPRSGQCDRSPLSWAATDRASHRCCGPCKDRAPARPAPSSQRHRPGIAPAGQGPPAGRPGPPDPRRSPLPRHRRPGARPSRPRVRRRPTLTGPGAPRPARPRHRRRHPPPRPVRRSTPGARARHPAQRRPPIVLLDEPTRGLDYRAKRSLAGIVDLLAGEGRSVVIATHDVEFVASAADRVMVMAAGDVVADGATADVVVASPAFAPQVAKILAPSGTSPSTR